MVAEPGNCWWIYKATPPFIFPPLQLAPDMAWFLLWKSDQSISLSDIDFLLKDSGFALVDPPVSANSSKLIGIASLRRRLCLSFSFVQLGGWSLGVLESSWLVRSTMSQSKTAGPWPKAKEARNRPAPKTQLCH
ncbi:hypothetical protein JCM33374_g900 [Metschnikowia sp. JCM 33374]|nr:hypothetical protein JCM33374_g900 [Metschnikowia sp. JCM 33374]